MMRAMVLEAFGGPGNFRWRDWPMPEPKPGEVRIRIRGVALNPVDYKMRQGRLPVELPVVLGRDVAGTVDALGEGVTEFRPGDAVMAVLFGPRSNGAYAEYVTTAVPFVARKPRGLSDGQAASLGVAGMTAYDAVTRKAQVRAGEAVLVAGGAGGVGSVAVPLLRHLGASPLLVTAGSDASAAHLVQALGVAPGELVRYPGRSLDELEAEVRARTGGRGVAAAFDFVGGEMKKLCFRALDFDGRVVSIVEEPADFAFDIWRADRSPLFARGGSYHFVALSARARTGGPAAWGGYREILAGLTGLIEAGRIPPPPVTDVGELSEATIQAAHARLETGHVAGKLVLRLGGQGG